MNSSASTSAKRPGAATRFVSTRASALVFALGVAVVTASTLGCEPGASARSAADRPLGGWEGHAVDVFDDNIDAAALGLSLDSNGAGGDALLRERAQMSDFVGSVRVQTVTVDKVSDAVSFHLVIRATAPPLAAPRVADTSFELRIRPNSPAYGLAKSFDSRLRGLAFIAFVRRYASADGEPEVHFHLSGDSPEVAAAVKEAVVLSELSKP